MGGKVKIKECYINGRAKQKLQNICRNKELSLLLHKPLYIRLEFPSKINMIQFILLHCNLFTITLVKVKRLFTFELNL